MRRDLRWYVVADGYCTTTAAQDWVRKAAGGNVYPERRKFILSEVERCNQQKGVEERGNTTGKVVAVMRSGSRSSYCVVLNPR